MNKKILSQLQENADIPIAELSKKVNLSATPCWARINKLYKETHHPLLFPNQPRSQAHRHTQRRQPSLQATSPLPPTKPKKWPTVLA